MVEQLEVEAQQGLHLDASLADMLETNLVMMQSQLETMESLADGESVQGLRDQIADLTSRLSVAGSASADYAIAESANAELVTGLRSSIDGLKLEVQQANRIITARDAEIETLSKIPAVVLTQVPDPQDHLQVKKTADPEADHYYRLSQFGKK
jgi:capsule polysaccharide export protein KpsE/RkpR